MFIYYILLQPTLSHHPPPINASISGYTTVEALEKMLAIPNEATQRLVETSLATSPETNAASNAHLLEENSLASTTANVPLNAVPFQQNHYQTSPVITDLHDSTNIDYNKDTISPTNRVNVPTTSITTSHQPNNNNTIYGYVTQQQLANFGTNVALGKELNT